MKGITSVRWYHRKSWLLWTDQIENKYGTTRENISKGTNKGFMMCHKTITANLLTMVGLLVEHITPLAKRKDYIEALLSISRHTWKVTYSKSVIFTFLSSFFSFSSILISKIYRWRTVLSYIVISDGRCGGRNSTEKMKCTTIRNCLYIIDLIKGGVVFFSVVEIAVEKWLLKKYWASFSENSMIPINFS